MKRVAALITLLFVLMASTGYALAWGSRLEGRPEGFRPGESRGVFIWHDHQGMHLRTSTHKREHVYSGVIRTDGHFSDVHGVREERGDFHRVSWDRDTITFRFDTDGGTDGLDFRVKRGDRVFFDLYKDGHRISTQEIHLGHDGRHPDDSHFSVRR